jgi:hypothetical protein
VYSPPACTTGIADRATSGISRYRARTAINTKPIARGTVRPTSRASSDMFESVSIPV